MSEEKNIIILMNANIDNKSNVIDKISTIYYNYKLEILQKEKQTLMERLSSLFNEIQIKGITKDNAHNRTIYIETYPFTTEEESFVVLALKGYYFVDIVIMIPNIQQVSQQNNTQYKRVIYFGKSLLSELEFLNQFKP